MNNINISFLTTIYFFINNKKTLIQRKNNLERKYEILKFVWLLITLVPKVFLFVGLTNLGTFMNYDWFGSLS